jgi:hypothetical protein
MTGVGRAARITDHLLLQDPSMTPCWPGDRRRQDVMGTVQMQLASLAMKQS